VRRALDIGVYGARGIPSTYSGYETFLTVLLPKLAERGHEVTMYCRRGAVSAEKSFEGVRKVSLPAIPSKQLNTLSHGAIASVVASAARHDVVMSVNVANAIFCLAGRMFGQPVVLNTDGQEWLRGKWGHLARTYFRGSAHLAQRCTSALVADSRGMRDIYLREFGSDSTVIPYCWTGISQSPSTGSRPPFGLRARGYVVVAGRLIPENNIDRIVEGYLANRRSAPILVLGAANYASPVQQKLEELAISDGRVLLGGHIEDRATYAEIIGNAACYLHGHSVGGINPSLLEAMGCAARIHALDTVFNREALGDTGSYFVDFEADLGRTLAAIDDEDCETGASMRERARQRAATRFSVEAVVDAYEQLLLEVVAAGARARTVLRTQWATMPTTVQRPITSGG
jgi:glycosyltransferase involved in cell wall biosynthesis